MKIFSALFGLYSSFFFVEGGLEGRGKSLITIGPDEAKHAY